MEKEFNSLKPIMPNINWYIYQVINYYNKSYLWSSYHQQPNSARADTQSKVLNAILICMS